MNAVPRVLVFDVNETLSDMTPLRRRFEDIGVSAELMPAWFAGVLRDGFAVTVAGGYADFRATAEAVLRMLLASLRGWRGDADSAVRHVLDGFAQLTVHPDVPDGLRRLRGAGFRLATLTNGSVATTEQLLDAAGVRAEFDLLLDVSAPRAWKPAPAAYRYASTALGHEPAEIMLVAVHPWDVHGARCAGLQAAWLQRGAGDYPAVMTPPTLVAADLLDLAHRLVTSG